MTYNEQFHDASLRHQIDILRLGSGVTRKVNAILDETRADLRRQVERRLAKGTALDSGGMRRLAELERAIDQQRSGAWNDVTKEWTRTALDVATEEPLFVGGVLRNLLPVQLDLVMPGAATLRALATKRPFQGRLLKEWAESASRSDLTRIKQQIRIGMVQGESARDIASRVFGVRGAMSLTRHQAEAVTRTVINGVSNAAQQEFLAENADLLEGEVFVATLDARTTLVCAGNDGKQFPVGKGPIPPLHVNCRSIRVGTIDGEVVGERPFKAGTERQMLREYGEQHGLKGLKSRDDLPRGHKGEFDAFSRRRMRELTGQVPARRTYQEWLSRQPADIQDDILGPARGKLFREGGLTLDKFTSREGDELTLDQLRERNRAAWDRAGMGGTAPPREPDRRRPAPAPAPLPPPVAVPGPPRAPEAPPGPREPLSLREALRESGTRLETTLDVSSRQQDAVARGLAKAAPTPGTVPRLRSLVMTSKTGMSHDSLPEQVGGDYNGGLSRLRISTSDFTNGLFLHRKTLNPASSSLLGNTQNIAQDLAGVIEMTTVHEYAHHMHMSLGSGAVDDLIKAEFARSDRQLVSVYAGEDHREFWAESLTAYRYYPRSWLESRAPRTVAMVQRVLGLMGIE